MIKTNNITKRFDGVVKLNNISLSCHNKQITGLIGPNGSGKSTLINILTNLLSPNQGRIKIKGGISRTFQEVRLWEDMTALENIILAIHPRLALYSLTHFKPDIDQAKEVLNRVGLSDYSNTKARHLSYGQRKLLEVGRALATKSKNLLLDEPFAGLFPEMVETVKEIILAEKTRGVSVVIVEHDMEVISELCDLVYVLDGGELIAGGKTKKVLSDPRVMTAYLGK